MLTNLGPNVLILLVIIFIIAHVAFGIASRWINSLFLIAGAFIVLSPISAAVDFPFLNVVKLGRVYITLLFLLVGFLGHRLYRLGPTATVFLIYVSLYVLAGLWSDAPFDALKYKGLYGLAVLAGFMLARSLRDFRDLEFGMRALAIGVAVFAALMALEFVKNPTLIFNRGRLGFWGMNPNRIGQTLAPMLIVLAYIALYDSVRIWRLSAYVIGVIVGIQLMYTGSRGAAGEAAIGCFVIAIPLFKRPGMLLVVGTIVASAVLFTFVTANTDAPDRLIHGSLETREGIWAFARSQFAEAPLFGKGWIYNTTAGALSSRNMHSIYLQTAVEVGLLGLTVMSLTLLFVFSRGFQMFKFVKRTGIETQAAYLSWAFVIAVLGHGIIEAGSIRGSTINGLMLPFGLGLFDRLPTLVRAAHQQLFESQQLESEFDDNEYLHLNYDEELANA